MQFNFLSLILLFGALQSLLFLLGLWRRSQPRPISFWLLVSLLLGISTILLHHGILSSVAEPSNRTYAFIGLSATAWMVVPPSLFLYVKSLVDDNFRWEPSYWFYYALPAYHFVSWLSFSLGIYWGFYVFFTGYPNLYVYLWVASYLVYGAMFGWAALTQLSSGMRSARQSDRLVWLKKYILAFLASIVVSAVVLLYLASTNQYSEIFEFSILLVYEFFVLALVHQSIRRSAYQGWLSNRLYGTMALPEAELKALHLRLETHMQTDRPYLQPDLKLHDLARSCGVSENELSQVFTQYLRSSFYDYINQYRLSAFENGLRENETDRLTISGLANQSGFKSKTSLYKVFREKYGTTPAAYLKQQRR